MPLSLVNVCNEDYVEKIECDKIANESYPISNLLEKFDRSAMLAGCSKNLYSVGKDEPGSRCNRFGGNHTINCGFMVERFVKAPVTITLEFKKPISVAAIFLGLRVGTQQTLGVHIFAGDSKEFLRKVGSAMLPSSESIPVIVFSTKNLRENRSQYSKSHQNFDEILEFVDFLSSEESSNKKYSRSFDFFKTENLRFCKFLCLKLTNADYVPCLSRLKIYQQVTVAENSKFTEICEISNSTELSEKTTDSSENDLRNRQKIPEDFYDCLTWHCMCLPVVLPCGRTVDKRTLEKYAEAEAACGRSPNDPFTAVPFTDTCRPVPNSALKMRIDKFFSENPQLAISENFGHTLCGRNYDA